MSTETAALYEAAFRPHRLRACQSRCGTETGRNKWRAKFWYRHATFRARKDVPKTQRSVKVRLLSSHRALRSIGSSFGCDVTCLPRPCQLDRHRRATTTRLSASCTAAFTNHGRSDSAHGLARATTPATRPPPPSRRSPSRRGCLPTSPLPTMQTRRACPDHRRRGPPAWWNCATAGSTRPNGSSGSTSRSQAIPSVPLPATRPRPKSLEEAHPHQPLQRPPAVARRCPRRARYRGRYGVWLGHRYLRRGCAGEVVGVELAGRNFVKWLPYETTTCCSDFTIERGEPRLPPQITQSLGLTRILKNRRSQMRPRACEYRQRGRHAYNSSLQPL